MTKLTALDRERNSLRGEGDKQEKGKHEMIVNQPARRSVETSHCTAHW